MCFCVLLFCSFVGFVVCIVRFGLSDLNLIVLCDFGNKFVSILFCELFVGVIWYGM